MQLHISPSMRSITISSSSSCDTNSNNGFIFDLMKIKVAARHISYTTIFHTVLLLAFLLPFVFILTALVTLEGVNKCSSLGTYLYMMCLFTLMMMMIYLLAFVMSNFVFILVFEIRAVSIWHLDRGHWFY